MGSTALTRNWKPRLTTSFVINISILEDRPTITSQALLAGDCDNRRISGKSIKCQMYIFGSCALRSSCWWSMTMAAAVIIGIGHGNILGHRNPDQSLAMGIISQQLRGGAGDCQWKCLQHLPHAIHCRLNFKAGAGKHFPQHCSP